MYWFALFLFSSKHSTFRLNICTLNFIWFINQEESLFFSFMTPNSLVRKKDIYLRAILIILHKDLTFKM